MAQETSVAKIVYKGVSLQSQALGAAEIDNGGKSWPWRILARQELWPELGTQCKLMTEWE